jgi:hypothetical protein
LFSESSFSSCRFSNRAFSFLADVTELGVMQFLETIVTPGAPRQYHCTLCGMTSHFNTTMKRHMLRK